MKPVSKRNPRVPEPWRVFIVIDGFKPTGDDEMISLSRVHKGFWAYDTDLHISVPDAGVPLKVVQRFVSNVYSKSVVHVIGEA